MLLSQVFFFFSGPWLWHLFCAIGLAERSLNLLHSLISTCLDCLLDFWRWNKPSNQQFKFFSLFEMIKKGPGGPFWHLTCRVSNLKLTANVLIRAVSGSFPPYFPLLLFLSMNIYWAHVMNETLDHTWFKRVIQFREYWWRSRWTFEGTWTFHTLSTMNY